MNIPLRFFPSFFCLLLFVISPFVRADGVYDQVSSEVSLWVKERLISRYPLASELTVNLRIPKSAHRLPQCKNRFKISAGSIDAGRSRIRVSCSDPVWTLRLRATSHVKAKVLVASHPIKKGSRLKKTDYKRKEVTLRTPQKPFFFTDAIEGQKLRRKLNTADIITSKHLTLDYAVNKGDIVIINVKTGTISLTTEGIALSSGVTGDVIKVRNKQSGKLLNSTVIGNRQVLVD